MNVKFSCEVIEVVKRIYTGKTAQQIVEEVETLTGHQMKRSQVYNLLKRLGLKLSKIPKFPPEVIAFLRENNSLRTPTELCKMIRDEFGFEMGLNQIRAYRRNHKIPSGLDTRFKPGNIPLNKGVKGFSTPSMQATQFKKGQLGWNYKPLGYERICSKEGYTLVKVAEPRTFEHKQRVVWKAHYGEIPEGYVVIFLDGDKTNFNIDNLRLITRREHAQLTTKKRRTSNGEVTEAYLNLTRVENAIKDRKK